MGSEGYMERYINPYTDFGFKKLFGTELNKDLLISFLNALLPDGQMVKNVTYLNPEQLGIPRIYRRIVFDVYCENEEGEKFLVEIQKGEQQFLKDRTLFCTTSPICDQVVKGKGGKDELKSVYIIGILHFTFDNKQDDYYHYEVKLVDRQTKEVFYDKLTWIYLEMPKFNKTEDELVTMFDKWMFVLRNLSRLMERPAALQERIFTRLFETAEIARFARKELVEYEDSLKVYRDWFSVVQTAVNKGIKEGFQEGHQQGLEEGLEKGILQGLEEGIKQGAEQEKKEFIRKMKSNAVPLQTIMDITGLSAEEIERV